MRISDWSSDVCSSDPAVSHDRRHRLTEGRLGVLHLSSGDLHRPGSRVGLPCELALGVCGLLGDESEEGLEWKSVVLGKSVSVRVDLGVRGIIRNTTESIAGLMLLGVLL